MLVRMLFQNAAVGYTGRERLPVNDAKFPAKSYLYVVTPPFGAVTVSFRPCPSNFFVVTRPSGIVLLANCPSNV